MFAAYIRDLTKRKLIPALYNLARSHLLPEEFAVVGVSRAPLSTEEFRRRLERARAVANVDRILKGESPLTSPCRTSRVCARAALCEWAVAWGTVSFACGARLFNLDQESS